MKNPLRKRLLRELKEDFGKYLVIFLFMVGLISLVSGFLVADNSMLHAYNEGFTKYNIEDGNFDLTMQASDELVKKLEQKELKLYENYYIEEKNLTNDSILRIYKNREDINKVCLMSGKMPETSQEIAIDRMNAENNHIKVGDIIEVADKKLTVSGLVALSDYSALFQNNQDMMFDSIKFGVAVMTKEGFDALSEDHLHYNYSWKYEKEPKNDKEAKVMADELLEVLAPMAGINTFIPRYLNQAINFTGDDMGSDKAMFTIFLYIVIVIIAFVFAITISNTISKEANVIGTLRASGYTKGELVRHYLLLPVLVTLAGAVIGNILGYTLLKEFFIQMYYGSYSLPTYKTLWNSEAFLYTTVVPIIIMFLINIFVLIRKLQLSPLKFLRHDLSKRSKKKVVRLNTKIRFMTRFRIRIIFQNMPNYIMVVVGVFFANLIILFGFVLGPILDGYQKEITENLICKNQYILKVPAMTQEQDSEKYSVTKLNTWKEKFPSESITIYGVKQNSEYIPIDFNEDSVYISENYAEKYDLKVGDEIILKDEYSDNKYCFKIGGTYDYPSALAIFMNQDAFNQTFEHEEGYFNGYFSNEEIKDIDEKAIASVITVDDLTKLSRQLDKSIGKAMSLFVVLGIIMFMLLIYLLSKLIIEKNAQSISMVKILGYSSGEIAGLYIFTTTVVVVLSLIGTAFLANTIIKAIFENYMYQKLSGWLPYFITAKTYVKMISLGILGYASVAFIQLRRIKRIPMQNALKNVE